MVHARKGNSLVFKPFLPALKQHLFRQNYDTREHNCRKLWTFSYLTAQPWALVSLSINKERKSPSWGEGGLTTKLTPENEEPWSVLIITNIINNSKTTWGKKHFSQSSKPIEVMSKKTWSEFLTEKKCIDISRPRYTAMQGSQKKKNNKTGVTPAALQVTHEAAQMKPEIQYLVLPITEGWAKKEFFLFQEVSSYKESWPFTPTQVCGNRNL